MKKYLLTAILLFVLVAGYSQATYYVSVVKGKVSKTGGAFLKPGDKVTPADKVTFSAKTDQLILLSPGSGRLTISPQHAAASTSASLTGLIKDFLDLSSRQQRLSANTKKPVDSLQQDRPRLLRADTMKSAMIENY